MSLFEACDLSVAYDGQGEGAPVRLEGISFGLEPGIVYDLTGPSGAGKSMLLRACAQMMPIKGGRMLLDGTSSEAFTCQEWRRGMWRNACRTLSVERCGRRCLFWESSWRGLTIRTGC